MSKPKLQLVEHLAEQDRRSETPKQFNCKDTLHSKCKDKSCECICHVKAPAGALTFIRTIQLNADGNFCSSHVFALCDEEIDLNDFQLGTIIGEDTFKKTQNLHRSMSANAKKFVATPHNPESLAIHKKSYRVLSDGINNLYSPMIKQFKNTLCEITGGTLEAVEDALWEGRKIIAYTSDYQSCWFATPKHFENFAIHFRYFAENSKAEEK